MFFLIVVYGWSMVAIRMKRLFHLFQASWSEVTGDGFVGGVVRTSVARSRGARSRATATALVIGDNPPFLPTIQNESSREFNRKRINSDPSRHVGSHGCYDTRDQFDTRTDRLTLLNSWSIDLHGGYRRLSQCQRSRRQPSSRPFVERETSHKQPPRQSYLIGVHSMRVVTIPVNLLQ